MSTVKVCPASQHGPPVQKLLHIPHFSMIKPLVCYEMTVEYVFSYVFITVYCSLIVLHLLRKYSTHRLERHKLPLDLGSPNLKTILVGACSELLFYCSGCSSLITNFSSQENVWLSPLSHFCPLVPTLLTRETGIL